MKTNKIRNFPELINILIHRDTAIPICENQTKLIDFPRITSSIPAQYNKVIALHRFPGKINQYKREITSQLEF